MSRLFPSYQTFVDLRDGVHIGITKVTILTTGTDYFNVHPSDDAAVLQSTDTASDPTFYLSGNNLTQVNIDGATAGTVYYFVTRSRSGIVNATKGETG